MPETKLSLIDCLFPQGPQEFPLPSVSITMEDYEYFVAAVKIVAKECPGLDIKQDFNTGLTDLVGPPLYNKYIPIIKQRIVEEFLRLTPPSRHRPPPIPKPAQ